MSDTEAYFAGRSHIPASMTPGQEFTAAMFVNDPNRRGPPPMLRPNSGDPTQALEWAPPDVAGNLAAGIAAGERFGSDRHARDLMGESGGTSDRLSSMDVYQEVVNSQNAQAAPAAPAAPVNPFGASRHQTPEQLQQQKQAAMQMQEEPPAAEAQWFMSAGPDPTGAAAPSVAPPVVSNGASIAQAALQAALAASSRSIEAMVRARNELEKQIEQERRSHLQLVNLAEQVKQ